MTNFPLRPGFDLYEFLLASMYKHLPSCSPKLVERRTTIRLRSF